MPNPSSGPRPAPSPAPPAGGPSAPPAGPPTPPVPLSVLLARADLGLRQLAGPPAGQAAVHWVHTGELEDPAPYLLGGELLLTAGVHIPAGAKAAAAHLDRYTARAFEAGAAALGFGLAPVHSATPKALVDACERYGLPLVEVPPETPFTAVARAVWQAVADIRHRELRRLAEAQQHLAAAAAGPDPVAAVLRQLARHLGARAAVLDGHGEPLQAAGPQPSAEAAAAGRALAAVLRPGGPGTPASATDTAPDGTRLAAYPLSGGRRTAGSSASGAACALVVAVPAAVPRDPAEHTLAGVAAVLLALLTGPHRGGDIRRTAALVRLLLGAAPAEVAGLLADGPAGRDGGGGPGWTVLHGRSRAGTAAGPSAVPALAAALGTPLVAVGEGSLQALLPPGREPTALPGWTLGASAPAPWDALPAADAQAAGALRRAIATRSALAGHPGPPQGTGAPLDPQSAVEWARNRLAPIAERPALVATLRTWLSLHGSWEGTAVALGVHRNTVRQRIARIAALLGADVDDPDVRADLWLALRHG